MLACKKRCCGCRNKTGIQVYERNSMKKTWIFFAKCILAALPFLAVIVFTAAAPLCYMDKEYPARAYTHEVIGSDADHDVLILGDSRAMADVLPTELGDSCVSLATGGATAIENYFYLEDYLEEHTAPKKCLILYAPFHYSYMDNFMQRTVYFNDLSIAQTAEVMINGRKCGSETICSDGLVSDLIASRLRLPTQYLPALLNARFTGRYETNTQLLRDLETTKGYAPFGTADGSDELNYETSYETLRESGDADLIRLYLQKTLDLCREKGIKAYLLQPPMNRASYESLQEGFIENYTLLLQSFADLYPQAVVETQIPCYENALFGDSSHLNTQGAKVYTEEIRQKYLY